MNNPLDSFMTRNEQKILGFLAVFVISGMLLYYTGLNSVYAEKSEPEMIALQEATRQDSTFRIDIRTADAEELILLPGIGAKRAADIIAYRQNKQFESTEELLNVKGIGAKTYQKMQPLLLVFGKTGAGVTNSSKLKELQSAQSSSGNVSEGSGKQELDETGNNINKGYIENKTVNDGSQTIIHLNTATREDLISLNGIGEVKAEAILAYRKQIGRFTSVEQLLDVKGIGPKTLEKNRHRLSL